MKQLYFLLLVALFACQPKHQTQSNGDAEALIREILAEQQDCWNQGDIECFMEGYWKSDSLRFIGKSGINYGWQATLDNYKKSYPDRATMSIGIRHSER